MREEDKKKIPLSGGQTLVRRDTKDEVVVEDHCRQNNINMWAWLFQVRKNLPPPSVWETDVDLAK